MSSVPTIPASDAPAPLPAIDDGETPSRQLTGLVGHVVSFVAAGLSALALYWVVGTIDPFRYRVLFLTVAMVLTFLSYPARARRRGGVTATDWIAVALTLVALGWPLADPSMQYRAATPTTFDLACGVVALVLVLEATRRSAGPILPATALGFVLFAYLGPLFDVVGLEAIGHRGYELDRLVGLLYMTLEGLWGVPVDVASTYIILFTIFGAVLEHSGAGAFFIDWALSALGRARSGAGPGRTVTAAGLLLGMVSGSGVAVTVTLGSVAWPLLRRAGYAPDMAGAVLSAAGIGAILAPPAMGAAAFLIAEFLRIPYLQVMLMAIVPTLVYYLSVLLMIEADSRRCGIPPLEVTTPSIWQLTIRRGYHFAPLVVILALLLSGLTPFYAVFCATLLSIALSFLDRAHALVPRRLFAALASGARGVLPIAATTATAGIIVGVVALTGLGLKIAGLIVALAGGSLFLTVVFAALAVWMLGLAVPVTASYIIAAVMIAPALTHVGVAEVAAHMFIFYYAVLSEVSPPTALSPFAAAAITGGNPFRTMMLTWKYTLPAFLVPFTFTLSPDGLGVLLQAPVAVILRMSATTALGVGALTAGFGGWMFGLVPLAERAVFIVAGLLLFYPTPATNIAGALLLAAGTAIRAWQSARNRRQSV